MKTLTSIIKNQIIPALCQGGETILFPSGKNESHLQQEKHNYWELCFLSKGKCSFYLVGKQLPLEPNTLVLIPPGTLHSEAWQKSEPYSLLWLVLHPGNPPSAFLSRRFQITDGSQVFGNENYLNMLVGAKAELTGGDFCYLQAAASHLTLFFIAILRGLEARPALGKPWQDQVVEAVQKYLAVNLKKQITLEEISNQVGLSPNYLCTLFRQATGMTIFEQLAELRLVQARFLLKNTDLPIYAVAEEVGYNSQFAFSRFFHKAIGTSPTSYRDQEGGTMGAKE